MDSLSTAADWLDGGDSATFISYINSTRILVPSVNGNAAYVDGSVHGYCTQSPLPASRIQLSPAYTNAQLTASNLATFQVGQAAAIAAIQAALDNHHAVSLNFATDFVDPGGFYDFWEDEPETALWSEPVVGHTGKTYDPNTWGAHEIAIVGYDASDPDPANHYWLALNSWGLTSTRPNGCFRIPMVMNYDSTFLQGGSTYATYFFNTLAVTVDHPAPAAPTMSLPAGTTLANPGQPFTLAGTISGYPPFTCQWFNNGRAIAGATSACFTDAVPAGADSGSYNLVVTGLGGTQVASGTTQVVVDPLPQLLVNPGFEAPPASQGGAIPGWSWTSSLPSATGSPWGTSSLAHSGAACLALGNLPDRNGVVAPAHGTVSQSVTLPATGFPTLRCWVQVYTEETRYLDIDTLALQVLDPQGKLLATLKTHTNQQTDHLAWTMDSFPMTAFLGQTVQLCLAWDCPTSTRTFWRVDDFSLTADTPAPAPAAVASFSPGAGCPGTAVTLIGTGFTGAGQLRFGGTPQPTFTVVSDTQIMTTVPAGAGSGPIAVQNSLGTGTSIQAFTVKNLDLSGDGVDVRCMATLAMAFGSQPGDPNWSAPCDLNGGGQVDDTDVALFLANF